MEQKIYVAVVRQSSTLKSTKFGYTPTENEKCEKGNEKN